MVAVHARTTARPFRPLAALAGAWRRLRGARPALAPGQRLGGYELVRPFAAGGMGELWVARHTSLGRAAAVKLVQPGLLQGADPGRARDLLEGLEREARRTAALRSPHTVQLYDLGRTPEGTLFYAMELLGGLNLEQLVGRFGPQPAGRVAAILRQACAALGEAHAAGLVHRDVKSANLQLTSCGGEYDFVKVLDFGLAVTRADAWRSAGAAFVEGTPAYLAPEAARQGAALDARADLYALGCVAYELLTGRLPFEEATEAELVRAHVERAPEPPSRHVPVPAELERLVLRLLEKDPDRRPQTAGEVEARLAAFGRRCPWTRIDSALWWGAHLPPEAGPAVAATGRATVPARGLRG